ncbi:hypothetical protein LOCC1_G000629, partial [Lachnellula occidentalis]
NPQTSPTMAEEQNGSAAFPVADSALSQEILDSKQTISFVSLVSLRWDSRRIIHLASCSLLKTRY